MFIKIGDYNYNNNEHREASKCICDYLINYISLNQHLFYETSDLLIDQKKGIFYLCASISPFNLLKELSLKFPNVMLYMAIETHESDFDNLGEPLYVYEALFVLLLNSKCSYFILDKSFNEFQIPKFYEYYEFINRDYFGIPSNFNPFSDISNVAEYLSKKNISYLPIENTFDDFINSRVKLYINEVVYEDINLNKKIEWVYPFYNYERLKYENISLLEEPIMLLLKAKDDFFKSTNRANTHKYTLVLDTETNGLPKGKTSEYPYLNYPVPVQISWAVFDEYNRIVHFRDFIVKPNGYIISNESSLIHGITNSYALEVGIDIFDILCELEENIHACDAIVGHNLEFDIKTLERAAYIYTYQDNYCGRYWFDSGFIYNLKKPMFCTMKHSKPLLDQYGLNKYLKLREIYNLIYNIEPRGLHNSSKDIEYTFEVYSWRRYNNKIQISSLDL